MAARSKKKGILPQTGQETQSTEVEGVVITTAEPASGLYVISDSEVVTAETDSLSKAFTQTEHLQAESESSEVKMNDDEELPESQSSETGMTDDPIEPIINLEPNLSIQNVGKLYDKLKRAYATYDAIEIDASHVASVDTATLQLFVALKKDAIKQKKEVDFFQPSPRFIESARLLDLLDILEIIHV
jgi:anti-anti-sigma regulatory factor